jgi:hypothetical protein
VPDPCSHCDQPDTSLLRLVLMGEILRADESQLALLADVSQQSGLLHCAAKPTAVRRNGSALLSPCFLEKERNQLKRKNPGGHLQRGAALTASRKGIILAGKVGQADTASNIREDEGASSSVSVCVLSADPAQASPSTKSIHGREKQQSCGTQT